MLTVAELVDHRLHDPSVGAEPLLVVDLDTPAPDPTDALAAAAVLARTAVLVGVTTDLDSPLAEAMDVVVSDHEDLDAIQRTVAESPIASLCLTAVLRVTAAVGAAQGLAAESFAYSTLLAGPEHARWRDSRTPRPARAPAGPVVRVSRAGGTLDVTLADPARRNAFGRQMRDELVAALQLLDADDTITDVHLRGDGPAFSSGGDLDEFGTTPDPATAHVIRTTRSVPALLQRHRGRIHAHVHGACIGAGVELPAFAARLTARTDAVFQLPELAMGLIPGAGGTVSLTHRIGRHRTAFLALSGARLDAATALQWGLVDAVEPE